MWYILYEMLSEHRRIGETWRGFLIQGLSRRIWDETSAVIKLTVFCSQEFVAMLCINNVFIRFLVSVLRICTVTKLSSTSRSPAIPRCREKSLHSSRLSFIDRGILWTIEPELFDTHTITQVHGYRLLQVVKFL